MLYNYSYDNNGNRTVKRNSVGTSVQNCEFNQKNEVSRIRTSGDDQIRSFAFDPNGYRVSKGIQNSSKTHYFLEGEHLDATYDQDNNLTSRYLRGVVVDEIVNAYLYDASDPYGTNLTYHHDQINSVTALTDHTGNIAEQTSYSAFGERTQSGSSTANILGYTGREHDAEANLIYYRARFYDPEVGRFLSEDPLGFEAGVNFYAYVNNNPVMFNDPMGAAARSAAIKYLAQKAVNLAWKMEQKLVQVTGKGTRAWSPDELALLAKGEKISGYQGHHINSVAKYEDMAGDPANINFLTRAEHFTAHEYNWKTQTKNELIDRTLGGKIVGIGATALFGVAGFLDTVAEAADYADPVSAFLKVLTPVDAGSGSDMIPTPDYTLLNGLSSSHSSAGGGFVIYPNKPNTNMMTQIYSK